MIVKLIMSVDTYDYDCRINHVFTVGVSRVLLWVVVVWRYLALEHIALGRGLGKAKQNNMFVFRLPDLP